MILTYDEFRRVKDSLPDGSMAVIANKLDISEETVRNYFGGSHYKKGKPTDVHFEKGNNGGYVKIENSSILEEAFNILGESVLQ